jgi:hypothetical protein
MKYEISESGKVLEIKNHHMSSIDVAIKKFHARSGTPLLMIRVNFSFICNLSCHAVEPFFAIKV